MCAHACMCAREHVCVCVCVSVYLSVRVGGELRQGLM